MRKNEIKKDTLSVLFDVIICKGRYEDNIKTNLKEVGFVVEVGGW
jgi:hypothetical protein